MSRTVIAAIATAMRGHLGRDINIEAYNYQNSRGEKLPTVSSAYRLASGCFWCQVGIKG